MPGPSKHALLVHWLFMLRIHVYVYSTYASATHLRSYCPFMCSCYFYTYHSGSSHPYANRACLDMHGPFKHVLLMLHIHVHIHSTYASATHAPSYCPSSHVVSQVTCKHCWLLQFLLAVKLAHPFLKHKDYL